MLDTTKLVPYLRKSLLLSAPSLATDEAFKYEDSDLEDILEIVLPAHNPLYTIENFPEEENYFVVILAKKEVYYRLATASAPFYPLRAEGAELRKDVRFDHYMALIRRLELEYEQMWGKFDSNREVSVGTVYLRSKHFTSENYNDAVKPEVELDVITIRDTSIDISWNKFNVPRGVFSEYNIYIGESPMYDDFLEVISTSAIKLESISNIHTTKYRFQNLKPNTPYYILVTSEDMNGLRGAMEEVVTTKETPGVTP